MEEKKTLLSHQSNKTHLVPWWASHGKVPQEVQRKGALMWPSPKPRQMYIALIFKFLGYFLTVGYIY